MLGSAGRPALLVACLPVLLLGDPSSPGAARAADVTISTPTTGTPGTGGGIPIAGGDGAQYTSGETVNVNATVAGGAGGAGPTFLGQGLRGSAGGTGLGFDAGGTANVNAAITGGAGGAGGNTVSGNVSGGAGGAGGEGLAFRAGAGTANIAATVTGGGGGDGGTSTGPGGSGGAGGAGLVLTQGGAATINAAVSGGTGGSGSGVGNGGAGGAGLVLTQGGTVTINAAVTGARGGSSGSGSAGTGGVGITGADMNLTLGGGAIVSGGFDGGGFTSSNAITFTGGTNRLELTSGATVLGNVQASGDSTFVLGGATDGTFTIRQLASTYQFKGFTRFEKAGTSTWTLTTTGRFTGPGVVSGGKLVVLSDIHSFSSLTVNPGGTLGGTGTVGTTTIAGGTLAPGNSIGTLAVAGNLSFSAGSTYAVEVSPSDSDRVNVTGTATLGGATVAASFAAGTYVAKQYTILNATGGVNGTFGTKTDTNLPAGFKSSLGYDANNAYLTLALDFTPASMPTPTPVAPKSPVPNSGLNPNQTAAANALTNFFDRTGGIPVVFGSLTPAGLSQVAGEPATGTPQTSVNAMGQFMATLADVSPEGRGVSIAPGPTGFAAYSSSNGKGMDLPAKQLPAAADPDAWRWSVWAGGFGTAQFVGADAGAGTAASTNRIYGAIAGADYRISRDTIAGFALGGGATSFNTYGLGSGSSDLFQAGAFIRQRFGASYVSAALGYAWQDVTTDRSVTGADHLQARFNANTWSGRVEAGHRFGLTAFGITPYAAGQITTVALPGYTETALSGASTFALSYAARETTRTRSELGLRADAELAIAHLPLKLQGGLSWIHNYDIGNSTIATFQALPGATFSVGGAALDRNALRTTASAELSLSKGLALAALFEGEFARNSRSFGGKGALRYSW